MQREEIKFEILKCLQQEVEAYDRKIITPVLFDKIVDNIYKIFQNLPYCKEHSLLLNIEDVETKKRRSEAILDCYTESIITKRRAIDQIFKIVSEPVKYKG